MKRALMGLGVLVALASCTGAPQTLTTTGPVGAGSDASATASDQQAAPTQGQAPGAQPTNTAAPGWTGTFRGPDGSFTLTIDQAGKMVTGTHTRAGEGGQLETVEVLGQVADNPDGTQFASINYKSGAVKVGTLTNGGTALKVDGKVYQKT